MEIDNSSNMTSILLLLLLFLPPLWPLTWPALVAIVFGVSVFVSSPAKEKPASQPAVAESSAPVHVHQEGN